MSRRPRRGQRRSSGRWTPTEMVCSLHLQIYFPEIWLLATEYRTAFWSFGCLFFALRVKFKKKWLHPSRHYKKIYQCLFAFDSWISVTHNKHAHLTADELKSVHRLALFYPAQALSQPSSPIQKFTYRLISLYTCAIAVYFQRAHSCGANIEYMTYRNKI